MNVFRTGLLMAALTGIFLAIGYLIGGPSGMLIAFLFAAGTNLFAYWNSDRVLLSMYGARQVDDSTVVTYRYPDDDSHIHARSCFAIFSRRQFRRGHTRSHPEHGS